MVFFVPAHQTPNQTEVASEGFAGKPYCEGVNEVDFAESHIQINQLWFCFGKIIACVL